MRPVSIIALALGSVVAQQHPFGVVDTATTQWTEQLVPVTLGVMSRCPDAIYCEAVIENVLDSVGDIVDLGLTFIGTPNPADNDWGVTCKHGVGECTGNVVELCAIALEPPRPDSIELDWRPRWWSFTLCMNKYGKTRVGDPDVAQACAAQAGIDWTLLQTCRDNDVGRHLLHKSVQATRALDIVNSCTVVINGRKVCVRDDSKWRDCDNGYEVDNFVHQIEKAYAELNDPQAEDVECDHDE